MRQILVPSILIFVLTSIALARINDGRGWPLLKSSAQAQATPPAQSLDVVEVNRLNDSALKLFQKGKYDEALPQAMKAIALAEKTVGSQHPLMATLLDNAAVIHSAKKQFKEAELEFQRAAAIREKVFGPESLEAAQSLFNLAELYRIQGEQIKAVTLYERVFKIREKTLKPGSVDTVIAGSRYACMLRKDNRLEEAKEAEARSQLNSDKQFPEQSASTPSRKDTSKKGGGIINGKLISVPQPGYPEEAGSAGPSGKVIVQVIIDETGGVLNACAVSGPPKLWQAAETAAYQARFTPTTLSGVPVRTVGVITYNFSR